MSKQQQLVNTDDNLRPQIKNPGAPEQVPVSEANAFNQTPAAAPADAQAMPADKQATPADEQGLPRAPQGAALKDDVKEQGTMPSQEGPQSLGDANDAFSRMMQEAQSTQEIDKTPNVNPILEATSTGAPGPIPDMEKLASTQPPQEDGTSSYSTDTFQHEPATNNTVDDSMAQIQAMIDDAQSGNLEPGIPGLGPISDAPKPEPSSEDLINQYIESDDFYDKFADNPGAAIAEIASKIAERDNSKLTARLQPLLDQADQINRRNQAVDAINRFVDKGHGKYDDFGDYTDQITSIIRTEGLDVNDPLSYENAYGRVKADALSQKLAEAEQHRGLGVDDILGNDEYLDKISSNENVKNKVITNYLNGLSKGESPKVITDDGLRNPAATPTNKIDSFKDAREAFKKQLNQ